MAAKNDMQHFLRFSLLAVFCIACLAVLGFASLVFTGPGSLQLVSAENLAGDVVKSIDRYFIGDLHLDGQVHALKLADGVLNVIAPNGQLSQVRLQRSGASQVGVWTHEGQSVPVSFADNVVAFHFPDGKVRVPVRVVYRR